MVMNYQYAFTICYYWGFYDCTDDLQHMRVNKRNRDELSYVDYGNKAIILLQSFFYTYISLWKCVTQGELTYTLNAMTQYA